MLTCPALAKLLGITHGFFTREGGVSLDAFFSLNCGFGSGDNAAHVAQNRFFVARSMQVAPEALLTPYQTHSAIAIVADKPWGNTKPPEADALVTATPGLAVGILTADCLPVLFADAKNRVVSAAHAGWKGAFSGVLEATLEKMESLGAKREQVTACIGPAIEQCSYEVGAEFRDRFLEQSAENACYFHDSSREGHFMFDLKGYAKARLEKAGICAINVLAHDTCFDNNRFFSYRRACLYGEKQYGRQISAIALKPQD